MPQIFSPAANTVLRTALVTGALCLLAAPFVAYGIYRSPVITQEGHPVHQPIPFSHKHHVGDDGIDCRYCHTTVETSAFAGLPSTELCMGCHSGLWSRASVLEPLRQSQASHTPLAWQRVNNLPDFVFFNHSIHVRQGVGCTTCHGDVASMPLMEKGAPLTMQWCISCHRGPEPYLRDRKDVTNPYWTPPADQLESGARRIDTYHIEKSHLTNCSTCHR